MMYYSYSWMLSSCILYERALPLAGGTDSGSKCDVAVSMKTCLVGIIVAEGALDEVLSLC